MPSSKSNDTVTVAGGLKDVSAAVYISMVENQDGKSWQKRNPEVLEEIKQMSAMLLALITPK